VTVPVRPLVIAGLGARRADDTAAIRAFCAKHRVPAMVTYKAKGVVADDDPAFAGIFTNGAIEGDIVDRADLVIAVGLDPVELLPRPWTRTVPIVAWGRWRVAEGHVKLSKQIVGPIATALDAIGKELGPSQWDLDAVRRRVDAQRSRVRVASEQLTADRVVDVVARLAAATARVTVDAGAHMLPATMLWPVANPNDMLISNGLSTMGFALPAAIGAALVDRARPVVALTGDGGLLICAGELLTAVREHLQIIVVVFNDAALTLIDVKQQQRKMRRAGVAIGDVAWASIAESFRMAAHVATTEGEVERATVAALAHRGPSLIDARIDPSTYPEMLRAIRGG
jgi:acetolactate synthase-1/2/3 large subunit